MAADTKTVLWRNILALMKRHWGGENLNRLAREAGVGPATATRLKAQETSVGVDVVEKVAKVFKVKPWQLLAENMETPAEQLRLHPEIIEMAARLASVKDENARELILAAAHSQVVMALAQQDRQASPQSSTAQSVQNTTTARSRGR